MTHFPVPRARCPGRRLERQAGQSLVEALVVLGSLASLMVGIAWLGRLQDVGLQLAHASRRVAFAHAHQGLVGDALPAMAAVFQTAEGQTWATRQGAALLRADETGGGAAAGPFAFDVRATQAPGRQVGDPLPGAQQWRMELALGDAEAWRISAAAQTGGRPAVAGRLADFDDWALRLHRETAILRGTGAAEDDAGVQRILAASHRAWRSRADATLRAGRAVQQRVHGVDTAWQRAQPDWDWLGPWTGQVPQVHLRPGGQP